MTVIDVLLISGRMNRVPKKKKEKSKVKIDGTRGVATIWNLLHFFSDEICGWFRLPVQGGAGIQCGRDYWAES